MNEVNTKTRPRLGVKVLAAISMVVVSTMGLAGGAFAQAVTVPADPSGGQMATMQSSVQSWVITYGAPVLFGLVLLGVLIRLGVKWARKAASAV